MKPDGQRTQQRLKTRAAILDATESIMREEGYAAVSSRRIAERAGLKSQLVHYHFGNMDEVFLALYRRSEDTFFSRLMTVITSDNPLKDLWDLSVDTEETTLVLEFTAIAGHRQAFRDELIRSATRARAIESSIISKAFGDDKIHNIAVTPEVMSFLIMSMSRALILEKNTGITKGHAEVYEFMSTLLSNWKTASSAE